MLVTKYGKAIRSTWPIVRIEYKNDKIGYLVDARGNGWKGQDRFYFEEKAKALKKAQEISRLYRELGADAAKFKFDDYTSYCGWQLLLKQAQEKHRLPYLTVEHFWKGEFFVNWFDWQYFSQIGPERAGSSLNSSTINLHLIRLSLVSSSINHL